MTTKVVILSHLILCCMNKSSTFCKIVQNDSFDLFFPLKLTTTQHFTEQIKDVFMWALAQLLRDNTGKFLIGHRCIKSHLSAFGQCKTISRRKDMRRRTQCAEEFSSAWNGLDGIPKFCFWIQNSRFTLDYSKSWNVDLERNRDLLVYFSSCRTLEHLLVQVLMCQSSRCCFL